MRGLGYINTLTNTRLSSDSIIIPTDESVCGLLFDYSEFTNPFDGFLLIQECFGEGQTVLINNLSEAAQYGIVDNDFMNGVPYYHISQYYSYIGSDAPLYVCFTNSDWSLITSMQQLSGGSIFQIGIWTSQTIWSVNAGSLIFTSLVDKLESAAEDLTGKTNINNACATPLSLIVSPNTANINGMTNLSLRSIPDASAMGAPKLSVLLMQNGTDAIHLMQSSNPNNAPVGCIGLLMACLYLTKAEESIGYIANYNLNKNDNLNNVEIPLGSNFITLDNISFTVGNITAQKQYIIPCQYDGKIAEVFFSGDPTLSNGDYLTIANNRIMHKCRRCIYMALFPYVNANFQLDSSGDISSNSKSIIETDIKMLLDSVLGDQISNVNLTIAANSDILYEGNSGLTVDFSAIPASYNNAIEEKDTYYV